MTAVCVRCGATRSQLDGVCASCGYRPTGEGLLVAWLLSSENLDEAGIASATERIRGGEIIRPSHKMLDKARRATGMHFSSDPGLSAGQVLGLLAVNLLATPVVGWVLAFWWRGVRPRASLQAFAVTAPSAVLLTALYVWALVGWGL